MEKYKVGDYILYYQPCKDMPGQFDTIPAQVVKVTNKMLYIVTHPKLPVMRVLKSKCELQDESSN